MALIEFYYFTALLCPFFAASFILISLEMKETTYYFVITILALRHLESASHYAMYFVSTVSRFEIHISVFFKII